MYKPRINSPENVAGLIVGKLIHKPCVGSTRRQLWLIVEMLMHKPPINSFEKDTAMADCRNANAPATY